MANNYMDLAFEGDADLRRAVSAWQFLLLNDASPVSREIDKQFYKQVLSWGYTKELEGVPLDTVNIGLRDLINKHLAEHPATLAAEIMEGEPTWLSFNMLPSDEVAASWNDLFWDVFDTLVAYKLCAQCGKPFKFKSHRAKYCGDACRTQASRDRKDNEAPAS